MSEDTLTSKGQITTPADIRKSMSIGPKDRLPDDSAGAGLAPDEIKAIRLHERISQPVFARYLNVSKNLVSDWERGIKKPGGPALRLLTVIQKKGLEVIA